MGIFNQAFAGPCYDSMISNPYAVEEGQIKLDSAFIEPEYSAFWIRLKYESNRLAPTDEYPIQWITSDSAEIVVNGFLYSIISINQNGYMATSYDDYDGSSSSLEVVYKPDTVIEIHRTYNPDAIEISSRTNLLILSADSIITYTQSGDSLDLEKVCVDSEMECNCFFTEGDGIFGVYNRKVREVTSVGFVDTTYNRRGGVNRIDWFSKYENSAAIQRREKTMNPRTSSRYYTVDGKRASKSFYDYKNRTLINQRGK